MGDAKNPSYHDTLPLKFDILTVPSQRTNLNIKMVIFFCGRATGLRYMTHFTQYL